MATCLVDSWRPSVGFAAVALLEEAGCRVSVPARQTCCGQPAYNSGDRADACALARQVIGQFELFDYVIVPSGSCAGMLRCHYPALFENDPDMAARAQRFADKSWELVSFLTDVCGLEKSSASFQGKVTYHDGCAGLRELGVRDQPRRLLSGMPGVDLVEHQTVDVCCGFGGTFCVKYPDISVSMVDAKIDAIVASGADTVLAGDLGCLLNIAGRLSRRSLDVEVRHVAEVLADMADHAAVGRTGTSQRGS
jgi:L-lactate dehydrogenase complex protein LldE